MQHQAIDRPRIIEVEKLIRPYIRRTPTIDVAGADLGLDIERITLKLELLQRSGSFKARGAFANLVVREVPPVGVARQPVQRRFNLKDIGFR